MTKQILSNGIITLRAVEVTDVDTMMAWENDSSQWDTSNTTAPFSRKQLWDYAVNYDGDIAKNGSARFIITEVESGASAGAVDIYDFNQFHHRAHVGIYIAKQFRQKGYATMAMEIVTTYICDFFGMKQIIAEVAIDNENSIKMLEKCRFTKCGVLKSWFRRGKGYIDAVLMQYIS